MINRKLISLFRSNPYVIMLIIMVVFLAVLAWYVAAQLITDIDNRIPGF